MTTTKHGSGDLVSVAREFLERTGLRILDTRWRCGTAELAVVAADQQTLVVYDIKERPRNRPSAHSGTISRVRRRSLRRLAVAWQNAHGVRFDQLRVDVVCLIWEGSGGYTIEHIKAVG
jgi:putative endonuclease